MTKKTKSGVAVPALHMCDDCGVLLASVIIKNDEETTHLCKPCAREQIYDFVVMNDYIAFSCTDDPLTIKIA